jgi:uncharacterized protein (DUF1697 family)
LKSIEPGLFARSLLASMPIHIAMLRGINVGGYKKVPMKQLQRSVAALGFEQVKTYIQSGNLIFRAKGTPSDICRKIERKILEEFGFEVPVVSRTPAEILAVINGNPFSSAKGFDLAKLCVAFLSGPPESAGLKKLDPLVTKSDRYHCCGKEVYLYCPSGASETKLTNNAIEKALSLSATSRNWNTVNKLYEMSCEYK